MTSTSGQKDIVPLQDHQLVKLLDHAKRVVALKVVFGNFKHNFNQRPFSIGITRQPSFCPVLFLLEYLTLRDDRPGSLFINLDNSPVSRSSFTDLLSLSLKSCGLNPRLYIAFVLGLLLLLQRGECLMPKLGLWVVGNPMLFLSISESLLFQHNRLSPCIACGGSGVWGHRS